MGYIKNSIEDLPRANKPNGNPPSSNNFLVTRVAEEWEKQDAEVNDRDLARAIPDAGPYRGSYGGQRCNRALFYQLRGEPRSNELTLADYWRFNLGHIVHDMVQSVAAKIAPEGAGIEININLNPIGVPGSAHADMVIEHEGKKLLVEIKSLGGFGFKTAVSSFKGPAEGPKSGHVIQAALAAKALGCDGIIIAYFSLENISANLAKAYSTGDVGRFAAEWHYSVAELEPMIATEVERIRQLMLAVENPEVTKVPRTIVEIGVPDGATITDPESGMWTVVSPGSRAIEATGDHWMCGYCDHRDKCLSDGA